MAFKFNFARASIRERMVKAGVDRDVVALLDRYLINTSPDARALVHVSVIDLMVAASTR